MSDAMKDVMAAIAIATEARSLRDAEWRAAVERVRESYPHVNTTKDRLVLGHNAALDALLRAMEAPDA